VPSVSRSAWLATGTVPLSRLVEVRLSTAAVVKLIGEAADAPAGTVTSQSSSDEPGSSEAAPVAETPLRYSTVPCCWREPS
jgi:hypothetical protein